MGSKNGYSQQRGYNFFLEKPEHVTLVLYIISKFKISYRNNMLINEFVVAMYTIILIVVVIVYLFTKRQIKPVQIAYNRLKKK